MQSEIPKNKTALIIGASRGLGLALAQEFLNRGWSVVGTVREGTRTKLHDIADGSQGRLQIDSLDITSQSQIAALGTRLDEKRFDLLFVNAGISNPRSETIGEEIPDPYQTPHMSNCQREVDRS